jgi:hypothetical protein
LFDFPKEQLMTVKTYVKTILLTALVVLSLGGFLLHARIHPLAKSYSNLIPAISGILSVLVVPLLFSFRKTIAYGYVVNGFLVIIGTVVMTHFSIVHPPKQITLETIILQTLFCDILILWSKFFVGKSLFELELFGYDPVQNKKGKTYRYPNLGWWVIHLVGVSLIYFLGHLLWR